MKHIILALIFITLIGSTVISINVFTNKNINTKLR